MTIATNTTYVQPVYVPSQQISQVGVGAQQGVQSSDATYIYFDCRDGSQFAVSLDGTNSGATVEAINPQPGQRVALFLTQDSTGSRTVAWDSWLFPGGSIWATGASTRA